MGEATEWAIRNAVRALHLGPCDTCGRTVHAGDECSDCLENSGAVRHADCCNLPFGGLR